jgi:hypothetical protein
VVAREALALPQPGLRPAAVLAGVGIAGEEEGVGDLAPEAAGNMHEADEADDDRARQLDARTSYRFVLIGLDDLRLAVDHKPKRTTGGDHREGFERGVQGEAPHQMGS